MANQHRWFAKIGGHTMDSGHIIAHPGQPMPARPIAATVTTQAHRVAIITTLGAIFQHVLPRLCIRPGAMNKQQWGRSRALDMSGFMNNLKHSLTLQVQDFFRKLALQAQ